MALQGKHSKNPHIGDCGMARWFIQVEICLWVSKVLSRSVPPLKKFNNVFIKAKTKVSVQSFCFMLKLSTLEPMQSTLGPSGC